MIRLQASPNFALSEFRCRGAEKNEPCCCHGAVNAHQDLIDVLQVWREIMGLPIIITSGFRCDSWNKHVGGDPRSFHRVGMAADCTSILIGNNMLDFPGDVGEILEAHVGKERGNVIAYPDNRFIHVDVGHRVTEHLIRVKLADKSVQPWETWRG